MLYLARTFIPESWLEVPEPIAVSKADVERLRSDWLRDSGRLPTDTELKASLSRYFDEEVLVREALRLGLDQRDAVVRRRLLMNMHFAFPESKDDDGSLLREARRLGMNTRDLVARRRLIQLMEQRLAGQTAVGESDLRAYLALHPEKYARSQRRAFRQVFFSASGGDSRTRAEAVLAQLKQQPELRPDGDPFLLSPTFTPRSADEIAAAFGPEFADAVMRAPEHQWVGPVSSPYGLHLIRVAASEPAQAAPLAAVRSQAAYALLHEREQQALQASVLKLRQRYPVSMASVSEHLRP
jgi:hypothetical protein